LDIFLARQPILDRNRNLFGYELLYRSSLENRFDVSVTRDHAAASVIGNSTFVMGLEELTGNHLAFLNVSRRVLESDTLSLLPHDRVVIELLEDIPPEPSVIEACRGLKERGFRLALDDYVFDDDRESLLDLVDIVKLDWLELAEHERAIIVHEMRERGIIALAEKVESWTDFADGVQMGCSYFQGFFFAQPEMIHQNDTAAAKANCLRLLREVHRGDLQVTRIEEVLKSDLSLSYKLLKYINSAAIGLRTQVTSIPHALVLLGERRFRQWATLATMANIGIDRPSELLIQAAVRGYMCESLAERFELTLRSQELFLLGMFSLLDAFTSRPMNDVLETLQLSQEVEHALLGEANVFGDVLECVTAWERADGTTLGAVMPRLGVSLDDLCQHYQGALQWVESESHMRAA
jgi:EAL and modified HD-GYP domain-containing signal transduction protein